LGQQKALLRKVSAQLESNKRTTQMVSNKRVEEEND
jgi:hypothetical protein